MAVQGGDDPETQTMKVTPLPVGKGSVIATFVPGELIGERFRIVRLIGQGGMGQVFEAHDLELGAPVALKVIRPEICRQPHSIERFKREVYLARQVTDANVCRVFDLFQVKSESRSWGKGPPSILFLTMELLIGETLAEHLRRTAPLPPRPALKLIRGIANGLDAAHRAGVIHRDFKSSNVVLADGVSGSRPVITDFGLAQASRRSAAVTPDGPSAAVAPGGTPAYVAPELVAGHAATAAVDIYSFGVVIHEMLTGNLPFRADAPQAAGRRITAEPSSPSHRRTELEPIWQAAVLRCLERHPERRFTRAPEVFEALTGGWVQRQSR